MAKSEFEIYIGFQLVLALAVKYLFYEDWEENTRIRKNYLKVSKNILIKKIFDNSLISLHSYTVHKHTQFKSFICYPK